jgi:hypothetical protein
VNAFAESSLIGYFVALFALALCVAVVHPNDTGTRKSLWTIFAIVVFGALTWVVWNNAPRKVHVIAAFGLFAPLIVLVFAKATAANQLKLWHRRAYALMGSSMLIAAIFYVGDRLGPRWNYATLFVEVMLIALFAGFWLLEYLRLRR